MAAVQHPLLRGPASPRGRRRRSRPSPPPGAAAATGRATTGRRAALLALTCTIPFALTVLVWQHARLMARLEGGGEYAAALYDDEADVEGGGWGDGVFRFVRPGLFAKTDDEWADDDEAEDDDDEGEEDEEQASKESGETAEPQEFPDFDRAGSIIPFDLSVNHLKRKASALGKPPIPPLPPHASTTSVSEDFLPVVMANEINLRWRHRPKAGAPVQDAARVSAYRILAWRSGNTNAMLWDSDEVEVEEDLPFSVSWPAASLPSPGEIIEWHVTVWDDAGHPHSSDSSRFAVGPSEEDWKGQWIVHPDDMKTFKKSDEKIDECKLWHRRRSLPLFRAELSPQTLLKIEDAELASALLVVSGLGSFRASFDGVPLSSSGPIDPPFTDYSKRVSYRGFDVSKFLVGRAPRSHTIGITVGSGWWDHRPISGMAKPELLPRGPATVVAQLYLTTSSGKVHIAVPTQSGEDSESTWQVTRGHIMESDLFTGEMVDLGVMSAMEGWDAAKGGKEDWVAPASYRTDVTAEEWRQKMALKASAMDRSDATAFPERKYTASPIGKLIPSEIPPILPMQRLAPDEVRDLGDGRWLFDFGKAMSGVLHFGEGLPAPIIPKRGYPRAHGFKAASERGDSFITVIYGESLEMTTGDINRVLVAGLGLHDGGPRHMSSEKGATDGKPCFPDDQDGILSQRDAFVFPKQDGSGSKSSAKSAFANVRQSHFTTHGFRFAEVCCTATPPTGVHALLYRTAFDEWGTFDSSNVILNGGYELVKNAMASNMLSVQSDCPHREKLPYGGDLVADSPAAIHMYDMSAFYKKTVRDWLDAQWDNGAYTETSIWQDLNDYAGIGHGAGETVWASAPPVIAVRHFQAYGDLEFLGESQAGHVRWLEFLNRFFYRGMKEKGGYDIDDKLRKYNGDGSGLGDWLALRGRDTFLTHTAFYMASARCVAYIAKKLGDESMKKKSLMEAERIKQQIAGLYLRNGQDNFDFPRGHAGHTPGPEMSLFSRIVPGSKRCIVLKNWFKRSGSLWPGDEEKLFLRKLDEGYKKEMVKTGELVKEQDGYWMGWSQWQGFNEGIFAIRYALKTLSDMGFHYIALRKAAGFGFGTPEYMLSHNATTMWESWWRSEDLYSRNHPMLGALAEWMPSSAAGLSLHPTAVGGRHALFWPRFPKSAAMLEHASAVQGTPIGDYAIAWRFENLPEDKNQYDSALVTIRVRMLIPPTGVGTLRIPIPASNRTTISVSRSTLFPDLESARREADAKCNKRRQRRLGFPYSWEYDRGKERWHKQIRGKSIGTPCESFLFSVLPLSAQWSGRADATHQVRGKDRVFPPGLYDILFENWPLEKEVEGTGRLGNIPAYFKPGYDAGPYCEDSTTFDWHIDDATHII
ncbi:hypothetical protein ACHAXT_006302 [Thalassiosira profunda]